MGATERTEVFLRDGRLWPVYRLRPSGYGPWPVPTEYGPWEWVATIEGTTGGISIEPGSAATPERINEALQLHLGIEPTALDAAVWQQIPEFVRDQLFERIRDAESRFVGQFEVYSNEEAMTGSFFGALTGGFRASGWNVSLEFVEFSKATKETKTGTDVALILDALSDEGRRSFKTIWLQAKRADRAPTSMSKYPRLDDQLKAARRLHGAACGLVYSPTGIFVLGAGNSTNPQTFAEVIRESMACRVGDMSVESLKQSLNRKRLFLVELTQGNRRNTRGG